MISPPSIQTNLILRTALVGLLIVSIPFGLTATNFLGRAALWENAHWTLATWGMTFLGYLGWRAASGEIRRIRGIMTLGLLSYAIGQILWDIQWAVGYSSFPAPSDIFYLGIAPFLIAGMVSTFRNHGSRGEYLVLGMDSTIIFIGLAAAIFALYGSRASSLTPLATVVLVAYPVVFLAFGGAGLVGALATRSQFQTLNSPYILLSGFGVSGACWVTWNSLALDQIIPPGTLTGYTFSVAHLVVGMGVALWDNVPSTSPRFEHWARLILSVLPVIIIPMMVILMESPAVESSPLRTPIILGGGLVILLAVIRQSLLLIERDRLFMRERDALARVEQGLVERQRAEDALRASEKRFRALFEESPLPIFEEDFSLVKKRLDELKQKGVTNLRAYLQSHQQEVLDYASMVRVVDANKAALDMYGVTKKEDVFKPLDQVTSQEILQSFQEELIAIADGKIKYYLEGVDEKLNGEQVEVILHWSVAPGYEDSYAKVIVSTLDITERKRAEEKIQRQNQRLKILREIDTAILSADSMENIVGTALTQICELVKCNRAALALIDWEANEISITDVRSTRETSVPKGTRLSLLQFSDMFKVLSDNQPVVINDLAALPDLPPLFEALSREGLRSVCILPLFSQGSQIGTFNLSSETPGFFDEERIELGSEVANQVAIAITQNRLVEELQQRAREREQFIAELTAKNAELENFTYIVSHDLKSPLVTMKGFLGYLEEDASTGNVERLKVDTLRIANAVDKMQELLSGLLELSRIGRFVNPSELIPFEELIREAVDIMQSRLESSEATLQIQPSLPAVYGDRPRLVEVLQNLIDNAAQFQGDQKQLLIEIGMNGYDDLEHPIFFVRDNGMDIPSEYHERIFGLFNKLDATSEGSGVGLALVKRIIEYHGGRIWVESETGKGSTFYFTIPVSKN